MTTTAAVVLPEIDVPLPIQFISGVVASAYYVKSLVVMLVFFIVPSLVPNAPAKAPARAQRRVSKFKTRHGLSITISVESSQSTGHALVDQKIKVAKRVNVQETVIKGKDKKVHRPILSGARKMSTAFVKMSAPIEAAAHKSWKPLARRMTVPAIKVRDVAGVVAQSVQAAPRRRLSLDSALPFLRKPKAAIRMISTLEPCEPFLMGFCKPLKPQRHFRPSFPPTCSRYGPRKCMYTTSCFLLSAQPAPMDAVLHFLLVTLQSLDNGPCLRYFMAFD